MISLVKKMKLIKRVSTEPKAMFPTDEWDKDRYEQEGIKYVVPMTAKEIETDEEKEELCNNPDYYVEEKFDGTRATLHFLVEDNIGYTRCFSRRISVKTGWFAENTDSLPQLRDLNIPELEGTVIDGEMFIPNRPFKDVASTLNCNWEKAIERQNELGKIVFHAFDIMYFKGRCIENEPLEKRKQYLEQVVDMVNSKYVELVVYNDGEVPTIMNKSEVEDYIKNSFKYPHLAHILKYQIKLLGNFDYYRIGLPHFAYYEYVIANGGEGVILKPKSGLYHHKRGKEYLKIKKKFSREVVILGTQKPTKKYNGKFPKDSWEYWEKGSKIYRLPQRSAEELSEQGYLPVTKFYAENWVGTLVFGVSITEEEIKKLPKSKKFEFEMLDGKKYIVIGECSGFDEEQRAYFTKLGKSNKLVGLVMEIEANEIFKDTGKLRHPRFLRLRPDRSVQSITWSNHFSY